MLLATFQLEHDALALSKAFEKVQGMTVEAERVAAHSVEWVMPCVWIAASDFDVVTDALKCDPSVEEIIDTNEFEDETYFHIDWTDDVDQRLSRYIDGRGSIQAARGTADGWEVRFRFTDRDQFDTFRELLSEQGHSFTLVELIEPDNPRHLGGEVTPAQREALLTAVKLGYYDVPRQTKVREIADELDISHQTLSELLRRGTKNLVSSTLTATIPR